MSPSSGCGEDFVTRRVEWADPGESSFVRLLIEIYSPELLAAQEELLLAARLEQDLARTTVPGVPRGSVNLLAAARQRLRLWDVSDAQIAEILRSASAA